MPANRGARSGEIFGDSAIQHHLSFFFRPTVAFGLHPQSARLRLYSMLFTACDYLNLYCLFDLPGGYAGYKPNVVEIPNGDGKPDATKRYLHVAPKYNPPDYAMRVYYAAFGAACQVANELGVRKAMMPDVRYCALRVLDYPLGAGSELHTDFDLFTLNLWRDPVLAIDGQRLVATPNNLHSVHIGELGELEGLGPAVPHSVPADPCRAQHSLVFFAIPDHATRLKSLAFPTTDTPSVGEWLAERIARSRSYR